MNEEGKVRGEETEEKSKAERRPEWKGGTEKRGKTRKGKAVNQSGEEENRCKARKGV